MKIKITTTSTTVTQDLPPLDKLDLPDMVAVVRCKDCKNWKCNDKHGVVGYGSCEEWSDTENGMTWYTKEADYCSYGERVEE